MTVVFVNRYCYPDHSATSQILSDLAASLAGKGLSVAMVASRQRYDDPGADLPKTGQWQGVAIHRLWTSHFGRGHLPGRAIDYFTFYLSLPFTLWPLLKRGDIVIAKTDPPLVALVVAPIARLCGAVTVNWLQDVFPEVAVALGERAVPRPLAWILQRLRNRSLKMAAMNVAIGTRMAEYLVTQGVPADRLTTIPNWAHEDDIHPMPASQSKLRRSLGLDGKFVVGYSGNLGRAHDPDTIYESARLLADEKGIAFLIIGGGHGYEHLKKRATESGLPNIHFLVYQTREQLSDSMAAADLHLVSLRPALEGLIVPSKFYGIAAAGRPIAFIGDPDGELARLIAESHCGFSVNQGQADCLARKIMLLAAGPEKSLMQGQHARQMLSERFSRETAHRWWLELLFRLDPHGPVDLILGGKPGPNDH
jgi:glycosyltransferase involved in cell wall biosynthesis